MTVPSQLLATKLRRPSVPPRRVPRPHLVDRLNEGLAAGRHVTLVSAPAGFGKSTVAAEWAGVVHGPAAWLSLDLADDDPARFCAYLVAALQKVDERLGRGIEGLLRAGHLPPGEAIAAALIDDFFEVETRFLLVLDDLHVIQDRAIYDVLERLVSYPPPALHLVLVTREDPPLPLARLRARNQLTEIRAEDLRFSGGEAGRFLNEVMGLTLSGADLAVVDDKIEGWIAGLQLAALALQAAAPPGAALAGPDTSRFLAGLSGSHRFILGYLTEEVLSRQPADVTAFLLQTSILDRLSAELCDAVTGRADSRRLLEVLLSANLFLIPLDDEQQWYRYHHLFADLLRGRLHAVDAAGAADLHRRAAHWHAGAGMVSEAVGHALAAADYALAVDLVDQHALRLVLQGHLKTVEGWMQAIPAEWSTGSVRANMAFAWLHFLRQAPAHALPYVERLHAMLAAPPAGWAPDPSLEGEWLALQANAHNARGRPAEGLALAHRALEIVPEADHLARCLVYLAVARAAQQLSDTRGAADAFQQIVEHGRLAANPVLELLGLAGLVAMAFQHGRLYLAFDLATQGVDLVERSGSSPPVGATVYGALAEVCMQWNRVDEGHEWLRRAIRLSTLSGYRVVEISSHVLLARQAEASGDLDMAEREIQQAAGMLRDGGHAWLRAELVAQQVRLHLARGSPAAAEGELRQSGVSIDDDVTAQSEGFHLAYLRLAGHRAPGENLPAHLDGARALAQRIVSSAEAGQRAAIALQALILLALAEWSGGDAPAALQTLDRALALGEPEGYLRVFVDEGAPMAALLRHAWQQGRRSAYVAQLLAILAAGEPAAETGTVTPSTPPAAEPVPGHSWPDLAEPLSPRELEILGLIRQGLSNQDIATRLVITLHTVKKHTSNIYGKLGVDSRTQAVARGRELGLFEDNRPGW